MHCHILNHHVCKLTLLSQVKTASHCYHLGLQRISIINISKLIELWQVGVLTSEAFLFLKVDLLTNQSLYLLVVLIFDAFKL